MIKLKRSLKSSGVYYNENSNYYRMEYVDTVYNKVVGDNVTLQIDDVYIDEDGYISYGWIRKKDGDYIDLDTSRGYELNDFNLSINNLTKDDAGDYYFVLLLVTEDNDIYYYISKPITLNLSIPVESITFENENIDLRVGDVIKLNPIINPSNADSYTLTWNSNKNTIVSVSNDGTITALKPGTAVITVNDTEHFASVVVNVTCLSGDLNKNNVIDLPDVIKLLKIYLGVDDVSQEDITIGDMNNDKEIGLVDVIILLRTYLGVD